MIIIKLSQLSETCQRLFTADQATSFKTQALPFWEAMEVFITLCNQITIRPLSFRQDRNQWSTRLVRKHLLIYSLISQLMELAQAILYLLKQIILNKIVLSTSQKDSCQTSPRNKDNTSHSILDKM